MVKSRSAVQDDERLAALHARVARVADGSLTRESTAIQNLARQSETDGIPVTDSYTVQDGELPPWETDGQLGVPTEESVKKPNFFQRYLPKILGGWSREEIEAADAAIQEIASARENQRLSDIRSENVDLNRWQSYALSDEIPVTASHTVQDGELPPWETDGQLGVPREESVKKPNFFQRRLPEFLGGWSREEIEAADASIQEIASARENQRLSDIRLGNVVPNWWQRNAFSWLGGWSQAEKDAFHSYRIEISKNANPNERNILEFVSERELAEGGLSSEQIAQLKNYIKENGTEGFNLNNVFKDDKEAVKATMRVYHEQLGAATRLALNAARVNAEEPGFVVSHDHFRDV